MSPDRNHDRRDLSTMDKAELLHHLGKLRDRIKRHEGRVENARARDAFMRCLDVQEQLRDRFGWTSNGVKALPTVSP